jgi:hypothetical protein
MDKIGGEKSGLANWKMIERVVHDVTVDASRDDPVMIGLTLVYVVQAYVRSLPYLSTVLNIPSILEPIFELLRGFSREILRAFIFWILGNFKSEINYVIKEEKVSGITNI